jgi:hypothetical protein
VLLQFSIVVMTVKSVYLYKKCEAAPSTEGASPTIIITIQMAMLRSSDSEPIGPQNTTRKAQAHDL